MPRTHHNHVERGAEREVADRPADPTDQSGGSWSAAAAGWDLVQLDWSLRQSERRQRSTVSGDAARAHEARGHTEDRFAARLPAMCTRVCRFVRAMLVRCGDDSHARATPRDP
jgi:hypothetical protein